MGKFIMLALVIIAAGTLIGGWLFMLTVGVIHCEWLPMMPTIGYKSAIKVSFMLSITVGMWAGISQSRS